MQKLRDRLRVSLNVWSRTRVFHCYRRFQHPLCTYFELCKYLTNRTVSPKDIIPDQGEFSKNKTRTTNITNLKLYGYFIVYMRARQNVLGRNSKQFAFAFWKHNAIKTKNNKQRLEHYFPHVCFFQYSQYIRQEEKYK